MQLYVEWSEETNWSLVGEIRASEKGVGETGVGKQGISFSHQYKATLFEMSVVCVITSCILIERKIFTPVPQTSDIISSSD